MKYIYGNLQQHPLKRIVYFRSTSVERMNYHNLLWSIPDEWFYLLSKGHRIVVVDESIKSCGKIERIFVPVLLDVMNNIFLNLEPKYKNYVEHYKKAMQSLKDDKDLNRKFKRWRGLISKIDITCKTIKVERERNLLDRLLIKYR